MKIASVVGARPQFIKAAAISQEVRKTHTEVLLHTGQHYDDLMSQVFFEELSIPRPDYNLGVGSASHGRQTGEMLSLIEEVLLAEKPDLLLVYGDTNSTLAGTLAAVKLHIPVAHVEAGLRSFNRAMPEEINRILTNHVSDLLFCPTETAARNLAAEGIAQGVYNVGDVMYDVILCNIETATQRSQVLRELDLEPKQYLLATVHRPRNTDTADNLRSILDAFNRIGETIVFPTHPRTRQAISQMGFELKRHVRLVEPVSYLDMLVLEKNARMILTNSGGVQKEAYFHKVPCIMLRDETEWVETVQTGWNVVAGANAARIVALTQSMRSPTESPALFGDGRASGRIVKIISEAGVANDWAVRN